MLRNIAENLTIIGFRHQNVRENRLSESTEIKTYADFMEGNIGNDYDLVANVGNRYRVRYRVYRL